AAGERVHIGVRNRDPAAVGVERHPAQEGVRTGILRGEGVILGQRAIGVISGERHRAGVAGDRVAVGVLDDDYYVEGCAGAGAVGAGEEEVIGGCRGVAGGGAAGGGDRGGTGRRGGLVCGRVGGGGA